jgi:hypothetical protein
MAIVISSVIILSMSALDQASTTAQQPELLRVKVVNSVADSFFSYAEGALRTSTHSSLSNLSMILAENSGSDGDMNDYYQDFTVVESNLRSCVLNTGDDILKSEAPLVSWHTGTCTDTNNFPYLLDNFTALVRDSFGIEISYAYKTADYKLNEVIPFEVVVNLTMDANITDDFSNWTVIGHNMTVRVPVSGVLDPLTAKFEANTGYTRNSDPNKFTAYTIKENKKRPFNGSGSIFNGTTFVDMINNKSYRKALNSAPSFLDRYTGKFAPSACCGIETFIDGRELNSGPWIAVDDDVTLLASSQSNFSFTDHELFRSGPGGFDPVVYLCDGTGVDFKTYTIDDTAAGGVNTETFFWLNVTRLSYYGLKGQNITTC